MEQVTFTGGGCELAPGVLLVSSALLSDPNFVRTLVLLLDHGSDGAVGVVLNRPSEVPVGEELTEWHDLCDAPGVLFRGGPVGGDSALALALLPAGEDPEDGSWRRLQGGVADLGVVNLDASAPLLRQRLGALRIFAGYAGWSAGQLEAEIAEGAWVTVPAQASDAFDGRPDGLWERVLRRQRGLVSWMSTMPLDPAGN